MVVSNAAVVNIARIGCCSAVYDPGLFLPTARAKPTSAASGRKGTPGRPRESARKSTFRATNDITYPPNIQCLHPSLDIFKPHAIFFCFVVRARRISL